VKASTYEPFAGPITLDTLPDLFASRRAAFGLSTMKADDDEGDDDTLDTGDLDDEKGDEDEGDDDPDEGKTEEEVRAELKATRDRLTRVNAEAKRRRLKAKEREAAAGKHKGKPKPKADDDGDEDDDDSERRQAETEAKWKGRVVKQAAKAALATAGATKPERLLRLVEVDDLDVDDDGDVAGLDDEIDRLKEEYPELFRKRRAGRVETGDRSEGKGTRKPQSASEKQAAAILGRK
jgi:hypothetical protein